MGVGMKLHRLEEELVSDGFDKKKQNKKNNNNNNKQTKKNCFSLWLCDTKTDSKLTQALQMLIEMKQSSKLRL